MLLCQLCGCVDWATTLAVNIFIIHLLVTCLLPTIGATYADRPARSVRRLPPGWGGGQRHGGFFSAILFYGEIRPSRKIQRNPNIEDLGGCITRIWIVGTVLAVGWFARIVICLMWHAKEWADICCGSGIATGSPSGNPLVSIIVPASRKRQSIEQALTHVLRPRLRHYEIVAEKTDRPIARAKSWDPGSGSSARGQPTRTHHPSCQWVG